MPDAVNDAFIGAAARGASVAVMCPITTVKTRMEARTSARASTGAWAHAPATIVRTQGAGRSCVACRLVTDERALRGDPRASYRRLQARTRLRRRLTLNLVAGAPKCRRRRRSRRSLFDALARAARPAHAAWSLRGLLAGFVPRLAKRPLQTTLIWALFGGPPTPCPPHCSFNACHSTALIHMQENPHPKGQPRLRSLADAARSAAFVTLSARSVGRGGVRFAMHGAERELARHVARHDDLPALARRPRVRQHGKHNHLAPAAAVLRGHLGVGPEVLAAAESLPRRRAAAVGVQPVGQNVRDVLGPVRKSTSESGPSWRGGHDNLIYALLGTASRGTGA